MVKPKLFVALAMFVATGVMAATEGYEASVTKTLQIDNDFGGCMALITPKPQDVLATCRGGFVTFSCIGDFNSKADGLAKFQTSMLAALSGGSIYLVIDDTKKHNGYCYAPRVDFIPAP